MLFEWYLTPNNTILYILHTPYSFFLLLALCGLEIVILSSRVRCFISTHSLPSLVSSSCLMLCVWFVLTHAYVLRPPYSLFLLIALCHVCALAIVSSRVRCAYHALPTISFFFLPCVQCVVWRSCPHIYIIFSTLSPLSLSLFLSLCVVWRYCPHACVVLLVLTPYSLSLLALCVG